MLVPPLDDALGQHGSDPGRASNCAALAALRSRGAAADGASAPALEAPDWLPVAGGAAADPGPPTTICSPSTSRRAIDSPTVLLAAVTPPAARTASPTRAPAASRTTPGCRTRPSTSTTSCGPAADERAAGVCPPAAPAAAPEEVPDASTRGGATATDAGRGAARQARTTATSAATTASAANPRAPRMPGSRRRPVSASGSLAHHLSNLALPRARTDHRPGRPGHWPPGPTAPRRGRRAQPAGLAARPPHQTPVPTAAAASARKTAPHPGGSAGRRAWRDARDAAVPQRPWRP